MVHIEMRRIHGDFGFESVDEKGKSVFTDINKEAGGNDNGFRPMQLLLAGLASCSAIDVVAILKKQRQPLEDIKVNIDGGREEKEIPALWTNITMNFELFGVLDTEKAVKACSLSVEKYCSVAETLRRAGATIKWTLKVNNVAVDYERQVAEI